MESVNKFVAVTPFKHEGMKAQAQRGLLTLKTKTELAALTVLYPASGIDYLPGDVIYVLGDAFVSNWAKNVYTLPGENQAFVLCPEAEIKMVVRQPRPLPLTPWPQIFTNEFPVCNWTLPPPPPPSPVIVTASGGAGGTDGR